LDNISNPTLGHENDFTEPRIAQRHPRTNPDPADQERPHDPCRDREGAWRGGKDAGAFAIYAARVPFGYRSVGFRATRAITGDRA